MKDSHYRLLDLVGEGQFGKVYTAIHRQTGELVALKELNPQKFSTKKFLKEMRILLSLDHVNIVRCHGIKHNEKGRFLITEYCEGGTLRDLLETSFELSLEQKLKIITDILEGLNHAHIEGIIHRDLKPENILLCVTPQGWNAKISDFGVAKIELEDQNVNPSTMGDTGSPAYMAPEQFYGKYSYSSDLYAVGIILYELLMGFRPFSGSPYEIMIKHLNQTPKIPDDIPFPLGQIVSQALQKLPQHRFRTPQEMKTAILRATLELQTYNQSLYKNIPYKSISLDLIYDESPPEQINYLVTKDNVIYLAGEKTLWIKHYQEDFDTNKISLNEGIKHQFNDQVIDVKVVNDGCVVATRSLFKYNQYNLFHCGKNIKNLIEIESEFFTFAFPDNYSWIALNKNQDLDQGFQIIKTKNSSPINTLVKDFLPKQIISIDRHHGVAIYNQLDINKNQTFFRFFNRRGGWTDSYMVSLLLHDLLYNPAISNTFLSREKQTNNLVLIKFNPFSIRRIPLNFKADFWVPSNKGFICGSSSGDIAFLDLQGNYLGEANILLSINSIEMLTEDKIIVITNNKKEQRKQIYKIQVLGLRS
ncbi:serine/threonine-protein kinase [Geminocystis sp. NIES-3709]|uniref:serine/threonine-protein kinase n=1 Tax=Geminocystis sp. NIES-3709 TaxID=1617448 RepID=UPI0005FC600F|nr:serine/threonine-protein kinase [Geminocystis sp. NIES-3709]BAQ64007.1 serine/threonine protein kinase [Geminocystis sp. NIES-3709]